MPRCSTTCRRTSPAWSASCATSSCTTTRRVCRSWTNDWPRSTPAGCHGSWPWTGPGTPARSAPPASPRPASSAAPATSPCSWSPRCATAGSPPAAASASPATSATRSTTTTSSPSTGTASAGSRRRPARPGQTDFDTFDVRHFITAAEAWTAHRRDEIDPDNYGADPVGPYRGHRFLLDQVATSSPTASATSCCCGTSGARSTRTSPTGSRPGWSPRTPARGGGGGTRRPLRHRPGPAPRRPGALRLPERPGRLDRPLTLRPTSDPSDAVGWGRSAVGWGRERCRRKSRNILASC